MCRCGHPSEAHTHYRAGNDCAQCECPRLVRSERRTRVGIALLGVVLLGLGVWAAMSGGPWPSNYR